MALLEQALNAARQIRSGSQTSVLGRSLGGALSAVPRQTHFLLAIVPRTLIANDTE